MVGRTLGHYEVVSLLGAGGMGEVYLARDTKLGREVALKVLPPALAKDTERRARFEREAKAIAALRHPGIVTIHSIEESDGVHFITMERIEGGQIDQRTGKPVGADYANWTTHPNNPAVWDKEPAE